ncbi:MAG: sensor histidine kinase [Candidatus Fervidibacter sp.]|uniref:sensor histidine kinase n=1 Tax=Candidatus Fervidibacter sp. TaxID=3100871 RepID=UPI00404B7433
MQEVGTRNSEQKPEHGKREGLTIDGLVESFSVVELKGGLCRWFAQLRWGAVFGATMAVIFASASGVKLPLPHLSFVLALIVLYNFVFLHLTDPRRTPALSPHNCALLQAIADLVALTLLLHFSGGVENPFAFFFVFHMIIASVLLPLRWAWGLAALSTVLYGGTVLGEHTGIIAHYHLHPFPNICQSPLFVIGALVAFTMTLHVTVFMTSVIATRLRKREQEVKELAQTLRWYTEELEEANEQLKQLEQMKSTNLRKMSHELRAPLNAAKSLINILKAGYKGELPPQALETLNRISARLDEMLAIVNNILTLSRMRDARIIQEREWVDFERIVSEVVESLRANALAKNIDFQVDLLKGVPHIWGIPEALREIASNLIDNAIRYTPKGGRVEVLLYPHEGDIVFQVSDTGIGIPPEDLPHIFDEFYRSRNAKEFVHEGTGLGLSIVKSAIEVHNGEIDVFSEVGKGTTFTVTLPMQAQIPSKETPSKVSALEQRA